MTDNLIERFARWAQEIANDGTPSQVGPSEDDLREAAQALKAKDAEIERLKEALKPFADYGRCAENFLNGMPSGREILGYSSDAGDAPIVAGHFRAARKALGGRDGE